MHWIVGDNYFDNTNYCNTIRRCVPPRAAVCLRHVQDLLWCQKKKNCVYNCKIRILYATQIYGCVHHPVPPCGSQMYASMCEDPVFIGKSICDTPSGKMCHMDVRLPMCCKKNTACPSRTLDTACVIECNGSTDPTVHQCTNSDTFPSSEEQKICV